MTDELAIFRETMGAEALSEEELAEVHGYLYDQNIPIHGDGFAYHVECRSEGGMTSELRPISDEAILESMRHPMRYELTAVASDVMRHKGHTGFTAYHSEGCQAFILSCPECEHHWDIDARSLHERLPEAKEKLRKLQRHRLAQPPRDTSTVVPANSSSTISINTDASTWSASLTTSTNTNAAVNLTLNSTTDTAVVTDSILTALGVPQKPRRSRKKKALAEKKARQLLFRCISRDQIRTYKKLGYIKVTGQDGRIYKIEDSGFHNVTTVVDGVEHRYCLMPKETMPPSDTVLAQKLWLETDIEGFLGTANLVSPSPSPSPIYDGSGNIYIAGTGEVTVNATPVGIAIPPGVEDNLKPWLEELIHGQLEAV